MRRMATRFLSAQRAPESWRNAADLLLDGVDVGSNRSCRKEIQPHGEKPGPQLRDGGTGQGFSIFATCIGPRPTSADARLGCASNIPMRKAPPADDRHVDFLALAERGVSPLEVLHNPDLALHGFIPGCIPPPFRPSKAQNTLARKNALSADKRYPRAQQQLYYVHTSTDECINSADAIPAPFEDPGRRRIEFSGNAEIWRYCGRMGVRCP
ncbi:hypothetical protein C8R43DRAFT_1113506 [Mycena crocata]|nr:hypothetical protein C8R43DRAFT_1113506 [Mycena crocata]